MTRRNLLMTTLAGLALTGQAAAQDRSVLPIPTPTFDGTLTENIADSKPGTPHPVLAPQGAPNVLLFMSDDVGFAMSSAFGGPVPTPNFDRLAAMGQRYNRFHTTGICSPSRAALLTGRNHHNTGNGYLSDLQSPYPGYEGAISRETATVARILSLNGYSTAMFGKHHNVPPDQRSEAGPFDAWPTGLGFDYFFGFPQGDSDQFSPDLYRNVSRVDQDESKGEMLDQRLADDLIRWVHNQKAGAPDKPFMVYLAPGSTHSPHQAPADTIASFKGRFDQGWDAVRIETWRRQIAMGIIPPGTRLTPRPPEIPAWDSLTPAQKVFHARAMEVAAAQLAFQDQQFGRVIAELQRMGQLDNTLVAAMLGDNGASGENGPTGSINELRGINGHDERPDWLLANTDRLGGPMTYENYSVGWAWAMNSPLRWVKQFASMLGGVRNGAIIAWPGHVAKPGSICSEFGHLVDLTPTVLDAAGLPAPKLVLGAEQKPMDGQSLLPSLSHCQPDKPRTQYFEIGGKIGLYHDGWFLSGDDGRNSWEDLPGGNLRPEVKWTLYDLDKDFSQSTDLAAREPARLQAMKDLWEQQARANNVFPLEHRFPGGLSARRHMQPSTRKHFEFWGKDVSIPAMGEPMPLARSFTVNADLMLDKADASGVVMAIGSHFGGWSLFLDHGRPSLVWARSTDPQEVTRVSSDKPLPSGATNLRLRFQTARPGAPADVILSSGNQELVRGSVPVNFFFPAGGGETLDIGRDLGVTVTDYATPHGEIEGDVPHVSIDFD